MFLFVHYCSTLLLPMITIGGGGTNSKSGIGGTTKSGMSGILGAASLISVIKKP